MPSRVRLIGMSCISALYFENVHSVQWKGLWYWVLSGPPSPNPTSGLFLLGQVMFSYTLSLFLLICPNRVHCHTQPNTRIHALRRSRSSQSKSNKKWAGGLDRAQKCKTPHVLVDGTRVCATFCRCIWCGKSKFPSL